MPKYLTILFLSLIFGMTVTVQYKSQLKLIKKYPSGSFTVYRMNGGKPDKVGKQWMKYNANFSSWLNRYNAFKDVIE